MCFLFININFNICTFEEMLSKKYGWILITFRLNGLNIQSLKPIIKAVHNNDIIVSYIISSVRSTISFYVNFHCKQYIFMSYDTNFQTMLSSVFKENFQKLSTLHDSRYSLFWFLRFLDSFLSPYEMCYILLSM